MIIFSFISLTSLYHVASYQDQRSSLHYSIRAEKVTFITPFLSHIISSSWSSLKVLHATQQWLRSSQRASTLVVVTFPSSFHHRHHHHPSPFPNDVITYSDSRGWSALFLGEKKMMYFSRQSYSLSYVSSSSSKNMHFLWIYSQRHYYIFPSPSSFLFSDENLFFLLSKKGIEERSK